MPKSTEPVKTLILNLYAGPSSGKSSMAAGIFSALKFKGVNAELVTEHAKELAWDDWTAPLQNQIWMFAQQHHRIFRLLGKVDVIVCDSPLLLNVYYGEKHNAPASLIALIFHEYLKMNNLDIYINRKKPYQQAGRWQKEDEAKEIDVALQKMLYQLGVFFVSVDGLHDNIDVIVDLIQTRLKADKVKSP